MVAGSIFGFGAVGPHAGAGMKRGTFAAFGPSPALLADLSVRLFLPSGIYRPILATTDRRCRFAVPAKNTGTFRRFRGDSVALGLGEFLIWTPDSRGPVGHDQFPCPRDRRESPNKSPPGLCVPILTVRDVTKTYANVRAVDGVSFTVRQGEIFALLGPNGAGKTSLVRMLLGILRQDGGDIEYCIRDTVTEWPDPSDLGYLPEDRGLYKDIPILRTLVYFGVLRGMRRAAARIAALEWLDRMGLADRADVKLDALSKGNQQKVQFISAVLHRPAFAVLDEPFSGLDPLNQELFAQMIRDLRDEGMTVLLSAHQMQLVEKLADRVLLMNHGREVLSGTVDEMRRRTSATTRLGLHVRGNADPTVFDGHPAVVGVESNGNGTLMLLLREGAVLSDLLVQAGTRAGRHRSPHGATDAARHLRASPRRDGKNGD